jgi:hypothetical protein
MAKLTTEQMVFLARHKIPLSRVFDATGLRPDDYRETMKQEDKLFACGVTPCDREGHTLRSRAGNCIQCDHANIAFMMRAAKPAEVYIAASRSKQLIKIGSSTDPDSRLGFLTLEAYGGADDWICVARVRCQRAGSVEFAAHSKLRDFLFPSTYMRSGRVQETYELFSCGYRSGRTALIASTPDAERPGFWERPDAKLNYNFPERRRE